MTDTEIGEAERHLIAADSVLGAFISRCGPCELRLRRYEGDLFSALGNAIVAQQISTRAADSIRARYIEAFGESGAYPDPARIAVATTDELRAVGLSRQKADYLIGLAEAHPRLPSFDELGAMDDDAIVEALVPLRGIGRWTVEMLLIFRLGRPDVFPADDLGVRNGMMKLYGLDAPPKPARMRELAAPWAPFRSTGTWFMWRALGWNPNGGD